MTKNKYQRFKPPHRERWLDFERQWHPINGAGLHWRCGHPMTHENAITVWCKEYGERLECKICTFEQM